EPASEEPAPPKKKKAYEPPHPLEIERYELSAAAPGADAPGTGGLTPRRSPQDLAPGGQSATAGARRVGRTPSDFEKRLRRPRAPEPVPALPLVSGVFSFPFYQSSVGAWVALAVGGLVLGICLRGVAVMWPFG